MRKDTGRVLLLIAGLAMLGSSMLQGAVNVPHLLEDLVELGVRPSLVRAVTLVLYFSVASMLAFGGIVIDSAVGVSRDGPSRQVTLWLIAVTYAVFGVAGFMLVSRSHHMLGYAGMGLLVAIGAALRHSRKKAK